MSDAAGRSPDGSFDLYYHDGWVHLVVNPPTEGGRPVYREDIQSRIKLLGAPRADLTDIATIIEESDGEAHRLVAWPDGRKLAPVTTVVVAEDCQSATVHITAPKRGALPPTIEAVVSALEDNGVRHGVNRDTIADLLAHGRYGETIVVATGSSPVHAQPAEIRYHFDPDRGKPYLQMEYGRINLRELNFIENKAAGALLAELLPEVQPVDGTSVTGERIPATREVKAVELVAGANAELTDGGTAVHATADGNVRLQDGAIVVEPMVVVENVDYSTGNIHFEGSVIVEKSIADGFVIEAGGDVQVNRGVGRATIVAGGNVLLKSGINGGGDGSVRCGGNFVAKYVEGSAVSAQESIFVEEAIMHSEVSAVTHCVLTGRRAEIISSQLIVGGSLWCKKLGSISEGATTVHIGVPPELLFTYRATKKQLEEASDSQEETTVKIKQIERTVDEGNDDPRLGQACEQLREQLADLDAAIKQIKNNLRQIRDRLESAKESMLVVEDIIYAGSLVRFGRLEYRPPTQGAHATILRSRVGQVKESGYNPQERPVLNFDVPTQVDPAAGAVPEDEPGPKLAE